MPHLWQGENCLWEWRALTVTLFVGTQQIQTKKASGNWMIVLMMPKQQDKHQVFAQTPHKAVAR
jgi:hypothetical protein